MNELSLFTGAGGGLLGSILLGWHPIGYVEWDDYCQRVIAARIKDGILPDAPIFGNIKKFISDWYAASYQGLVDIITAGFPCQPFSVAGKQKGADDERNMWPATAECIGIVRPRFVLLENVPGIRTYLPVVVRDLRRLGYEVSRPLILGADDVGAPHRRKRVWILAYALRDERGELRRARVGIGATDKEASDSPEMRRGEGHAIPRRSREGAGTEGERGGLADRYGHVTDTPQRQDDRRNGMGMDSAAEGREGVNASAIPCNQYGPNALRLNGDDAGLCASEISQQQEAEVFGGDAADADETGWRKQRGSKPVREEYAAPECGGWSESWPEVAARLCRASYGLADWLEQNWGRINHGASKTVSRQEVSDLWESFQSGEIQRTFGRCYPLLKTDDVFAVLCQLKRASDAQDNLPFEGAAIQRNCMRAVFIPRQFGRASQRREYQEQCPGEPGDDMPSLSHEIALATESVVWWHGCETDTSDRVSRLKALGNGQVPQCMATAFRILTGQIQGLLREVREVRSDRRRTEPE